MTVREIVLYSFFNSSTTYRVRIALDLKGLDWQHIGVNLRAGEQHTDAYQSVNPAGLVPVLRDGDRTLTQSLAIIDYLDRLQPEPLLIPSDEMLRTRVLEISMFVACEMHPLNNMRVQRYLRDELQLSGPQVQVWVEHWWKTGFQTLEHMLPEREGWCVGAAPTMADCCVVPQVANAMRGGFDLARYPRIRQHFAFCQQHPAFVAAAPNAQPDFVGH